LLKKEPKKLLSITGGDVLAFVNSPSDAMSKSFLLLSFKKEVFLPGAV
jgi:hypothetical protein